MKKQQLRRHYNEEMASKGEKRMKNPGKQKKKEGRKVMHEIEEWDDVEDELRQLRNQDSMEDYFEDDENEDL